MRTFDSGATRDTSDNKPQYEGYLSPLVLQAFGRYMLKHQVQADGVRRPADNWQKGIPQDAYIDSMFRHFMDVWAMHRGYPGEGTQDLGEALCALMFNVMGYLHEYVKPYETDYVERKHITDIMEDCYE